MSPPRARQVIIVETTLSGKQERDPTARIRDIVAITDTNPDLHQRSTGILAFLLGGLLLSVVGLVIELIGATGYPLPFMVLILIGWVLVGSVATTAFFMGNEGSKNLRGELAFASMGLLAVGTPTTLIVLTGFMPMSNEATLVTDHEAIFGAGILGALALLGTLTLSTSRAVLLILLIPAIGVWATGLAFLPETNNTSWAVHTAILLAALLPAVATAVTRIFINRGRLERKALEHQLDAFGSELDRARSVHDAMFPDPIDGDVRFEYTYNPLLGIGGDFLHTHVHEASGRLTLTLLDVSGHGLAAALTVNRLFGELERICAEHPEDVSPELLMEGLNRYVHLVMAKHSLYATAACVQLDPGTGTLLWSVAGHPPPLLRRKNGSVEDLECTCLILGAVGSEEFDPQQQSLNVAIGDTVIVYTDGTFESRNAHGEFFGLQRLRETLAFDTPPREWSTFVAHAVEQFQGRHKGRSQLIEDDLLVASLSLGGRRRVVRVTPSSQVDLPLKAPVTSPGEGAMPSPVEDQAPH